MKSAQIYRKMNCFLYPKRGIRQRFDKNFITEENVVELLKEVDKTIFAT